MKRIVVAALLLLGLSIIMVSCNKESSGGSLTGLWLSSDYEYYLNGSLQTHTSETDATYGHENATIRFIDGTSGTFDGHAEFTFTKSGNTITISCPRSSRINGSKLEVMGNNKLRWLRYFDNSDDDYTNVIFQKQ